MHPTTEQQRTGVVAIEGSAEPYRDRSARLLLFGVVTLLVAGVWLLLAGLQLLLPFVGAALTGIEAGIDPSAALVGAATYVVLAGVFAWAGIGALRRRRWVPPVMRVLAWTWLLAGVLVVLMSAWIVDSLLDGSAAGDLNPLPGEIRWVVKGVLLGAETLAGIALPLLYLWAFRGRDVESTCRAHDPQPAWSERCPTSVLGLSLGLGAAALLALPLAIRPVVPLFGWVVTGWAGALLTLVVAAVCAWLAGSVYRLERAGWWGSLLLLVAIGVATAVTFQAAGLDTVLREMGHPDDQLAPFRGAARPVAVWSTLAFTALTVVYMLGIRRHFVSSGSRAARER